MKKFNYNSIDKKFSFAVSLHQKGNLNAAEKIYKEILKYNSRHFQSLGNLGYLSYNIKKYDIAKKYLSKAIEIHPEFEDAHNILKEDLDARIKDFKYWNKIATCYIIEKIYTRADYFLDLALSTAKTKRDKAVVLNNKGVVLLENKRFDEAKDYFKKSIELSKSYLTPRYNLTQIYLKYGILNKAKKQLDLLLRKNATDIDFLNSKAYLELMENDYKDALVYFNLIPAEYRHRDDIATNMAMTYLMLGLYDNAKTTLAKADRKDNYYESKQAEIEKKLEKLTEKKI